MKLKNMKTFEEHSSELIYLMIEAVKLLNRSNLT